MRRLRTTSFPVCTEGAVRRYGGDGWQGVVGRTKGLEAAVFAGGFVRGSGIPGRLVSLRTHGVSLIWRHIQRGHRAVRRTF